MFLKATYYSCHNWMTSASRRNSLTNELSTSDRFVVKSNQCNDVLTQIPFTPVWITPNGICQCTIPVLSFSEIDLVCEGIPFYCTMLSISSKRFLDFLLEEENRWMHHNSYNANGSNKRKLTILKVCTSIIIYISSFKDRSLISSYQHHQSIRALEHQSIIASEYQ